MRRQLITYKLLQPVQTNPTTSIMEKLESGYVYKWTCIGCNNQFLRFPCLSFLMVAKSVNRSSCVYSACDIFRDSNRSINCARLIFASSAALPIDMSLFWKRKRAMDSLTTLSGSVSPTDFRLFKRVFSSFINTFYVCSGISVKQNSGIKTNSGTKRN